MSTHKCPLCEVELRIIPSMGSDDSAQHPYAEYGEECPLAHMPEARGGGIALETWAALGAAIRPKLAAFPKMLDALKGLLELTVDQALEHGHSAEKWHGVIVARAAIALAEEAGA